jgi:ABC-type multidrug transport system ATPase subunit
MLIIDEGKKIVEGTVESLLDPAKTVVEVTVDNVITAANRIETTAWSGNLIRKENNHLIFQLPKHMIPELNRSLVHLEINVLSLQVKNSLEAQFLSLTRSKQYVAAFTD